jgi:hypothetical protein
MFPHHWTPVGLPPALELVNDRPLGHAHPRPASGSEKSTFLLMVFGYFQPISAWSNICCSFWPVLWLDSDILRHRSHPSSVIIHSVQKLVPSCHPGGRRSGSHLHAIFMSVYVDLCCQCLGTSPRFLMCSSVTVFLISLGPSAMSQYIKHKPKK